MRTPGASGPDQEEPQRVERGSFAVAAETLFVDVVLGFQPLEERLEERLAVVRRADNRHLHVLHGVREVAGTRSQACGSKMAEPVVREALHVHLVDFESPLLIALTLNSP